MHNSEQSGYQHTLRASLRKLLNREAAASEAGDIVDIKTLHLEGQN